MSLLKSLGPGVLFAGAAIGTSHLVQSTRAGAMFGLGLLLVVILANLIKYPAFRFGPQYAAATGQSLMVGYRDLGRWAVVLVLLLELGVIPIIIAATGLVTAAIFLAVSGIDWDPRYVGIGLIGLGVATLIVGGYRLLDRLTKLFVAILTVATIAATALSIGNIDWSMASFSLPTMDFATFAFVIALLGWMPSGMELSIVHSLWCGAKRRASDEQNSQIDALLDFNIGYIGSALLACCFVLMGASVMHGQGIAPAAGAAAFASQIISLYTTNLGNWAGKLVGISALLVMLSTLITVLDGLPRIVAAGIAAWRGRSADDEEAAGHSSIRFGAMILLSIAGAVVLLALMSNFRQFIDFVTITAFVVGPFMALLNHLAMRSARVPAQHRPSLFLQAWSVLAITVLTLLAGAFVYARFLAG